jgi:hypothetical protein
MIRYRFCEVCLLLCNTLHLLAMHNCSTLFCWLLQRVSDDCTIEKRLECGIDLRDLDTQGRCFGSAFSVRDCIRTLWCRDTETTTMLLFNTS